MGRSVGIFIDLKKFVIDLVLVKTKSKIKIILNLETDFFRSMM